MTENTDGTPPREVLQLAMLMQARDSRQWGMTTDNGATYHPTWDEQGELGQQEYLKDAAALVAAMRILGWGDPQQLESARRIAVRLEQELAEAEAPRQDPVLVQLHRYMERYEDRRGATAGQQAVLDAVESILNGAQVAWAPSDDRQVQS